MPTYNHVPDYEDDYSAGRSARIRHILFPEFNEEQSAQQVQQEFRSSIIIKLAGQSLKLRNAVVDIMNYQDEVESSLQSIPALIEMLCGVDERTFGRAINDVYLLSKKDKKIMATLSSNERLIGSLVSAAARSSDYDTQRKAAAALKNFSDEKNGRMCLFRTGGIPQLVQMLSSPYADILRHAVNTLYNLLVNIEEAKEETTRCGGLQAFTRLLNDPNRKLQAMVSECLYRLMKDCPENKLHFLSVQGPQLLIKILYDLPDYYKLVQAVIRCIRTISTCNHNKGSLIHIGAMEALRIHLETSDDTGKKGILQAIRNLSDAATNVDNLDRLVADLIALIEKHHEEEVISCACGILSNLTCNNIRNKQTLCSNAGVAVLCDALRRFAHVEDVTEPALCTLRHCTARHALAQQAQNDIRQCQYAYAVLLDLLVTGRLPIMKATLGLIRNCALSFTNLEGIVS
uniref:Armadillo/beta-catenin-like repeat protein n=1 Tax=Steinernema glaseri TaxID=37863 RepID=A0A1I7YVX9_9BILA